MTLEGVEGPTKFVGKHNFEVRCDGFGTMSDILVAEYKAYRPNRYMGELVASLIERIEVLEAK